MAPFRRPLLQSVDFPPLIQRPSSEPFLSNALLPDHLELNDEHTESQAPKVSQTTLFLEEDKRAATNVQNGFVFFFFVFSLKKALILRKVLGEKV